jgi:hypothetical protein
MGADDLDRAAETRSQAHVRLTKATGRLHTFRGMRNESEQCMGSICMEQNRTRSPYSKEDGGTEGCKAKKSAGDNLENQEVIPSMRVKLHNN